MNNSTETTAPEREPSPNVSNAGLVRPVKRRVIAGVASGLADYWNVSPVLTRIGFVLLTTVGGLGLLLYVAGWLLIPNDDGTESIAEEALRKARSGESHAGIILIGLAALIGLSSINGVDGGLAWAVSLGVVGYLLYRGDFGPGSDGGNPRPTGTDGPTSAYQSNPVSSFGSDQAETGGGTTPPPPPPTRTRMDRPPRPPRTPRSRRERSILGRLSTSVALITMGCLALADSAGADIEFHHYVGALLAVVSVGLVVGAFAGRARWLVVVGLLLLPLAAAARLVPAGNWLVSVNDVDNVQIDPLAATDLETNYNFETGNIVFDLRGLDGEPFDLQVDLKAGDLTVLLPDDPEYGAVDLKVGVGRVTVATGTGPQPQLDVAVGIGGISAPGPDRGGLGLNYTLDGDAPVAVHIDLGIGQVKLTK